MVIEICKCKELNPVYIDIAKLRSENRVESEVYCRVCDKSYFLNLVVESIEVPAWAEDEETELVDK
jgi:hypothetical protein